MSFLRQDCQKLLPDIQTVSHTELTEIINHATLWVVRHADYSDAM